MTYFSSIICTILSSNNFWERAPLSANLTDSCAFSGKLLELKIIETMGEKEVVTDALFDPWFTNISFKVNETVSINHEIPSPSGFLAQKLYLGNWPTPELLTTTTTTSTSTTQRSEEVFR